MLRTIAKCIKNCCELGVRIIFLKDSFNAVKGASAIWKALGKVAQIYDVQKNAHPR